MQNRLLLLLDYRGYFYSTVRYRTTRPKSTDASLDLQLLNREFQSRGIELDVRHFSEVDFHSQSYAERWVLYQSTEDPSLFYKSYIEDVMLGLQMQGARLIPRFEYFRAHHNKVFMEILRDVVTAPDLRTFKACHYGSYEDLIRDQPKLTFPVVVKPSEGSLSRGVQLVQSMGELRSYARTISKSMDFVSELKGWVKMRLRSPYVKPSNHRRKFIVEQFIPGLQNDFKVLVYGTKYYVLKRENRKDDFRASGSGIFSWPDSLPSGILDFASSLFKAFDVPYVSIDIGYDGERYHVFEFQFISFGDTGLLRSPHHFIREGEDWRLIRQPSVTETEIAESVANFMSKNTDRQAAI